LSRSCTFLRWCVREGHVDAALVEALMGRDNPLRQIPRLYGKVQAPRPARWLSHEEAFDRLIGACRDGTDLGLRDEALIRLGLAGLRAAEMIHLRVGDLRLQDPEPRISWIGKKRQARRIVPGPALIATLEALLRRRERFLGRRLLVDEPVLWCGKSGPRTGELAPSGLPANSTPETRWILRARDQAFGPRVSGVEFLAGPLAGASPRRYRCSRLLPNGRSWPGSAMSPRTTFTASDGSHHFDLLDIQKVLGHSDPATTMRSYLDPLDTGVLTRAARVLD
jgi:integrase